MTSIDTDPTLTEGDLIQWYRVEKILGRGGFGVTYLATDTNLDHVVAIKEYLPGSLVRRQPDHTLVAVTESTQAQYRDGLQRFLREARTLVKFRHPNIVRVMAVFEANNTAYLVMEYEEGEQFKEYVKRVGEVAESKLKSLILSVIDGLGQVHQRGFIHRDIKPVNLIIRKDGSPVLLDFGATRPVENDLQVPHTSFVSAGYTPLEQYQEGAGLTVGPWTDIYSLGATLYYAISGVTPVSPISRLAALVKKSRDPLTPAIQIGSDQYSNAFLQAIDWALGFRVEDRPQSLSQWRNAFIESPLGNDSDSALRVPLDLPNPDSAEPVRSKLLVRNPETTRKPAAASEPKSSSSRWWITVLGGVVAITVAGFYWWQQVQQDQQKQSQLEELVRRADSAYASGNAVASARPLYLQILEARPGDPHALDQLQQITEQLVNEIDGDLAAGKLNQAQAGIEQLKEIDLSRVADLTAKLAQQQQEVREQERLRNVQRLIDSRSYGDALTEISALRQQMPDNPALNRFESDIRSAIRAEEERAARSAQARREKEASRLEIERRIAAANERQRQRRRNYRRYLDGADEALQQGQIASARRLLDNAVALQINDSELQDIEARLVSAENFLTRPLSTFEISYAREQFNRLERAIEAKNLRAMIELTEEDSLRRGLFETLFGRYTQILVQVRDIEAKLDPKRVTAVLRIEKMVLPNGDVVFPAASYRDSALSVEKKRYSWSAISW